MASYTLPLMTSPTIPIRIKKQMDHKSYRGVRPLVSCLTDYAGETPKN